MIPESEQNRTVDLYGARRFPDEWHLEETLFSGLRAVDSTVHEADGRLVVTARDFGSTVELLESEGADFTVFGGQFGRETARKLVRLTSGRRR
jgi:hypothetical protein